MGRAVGETMAVIMVAGNALQLPTSVLDPVRTLTSNIALEMGYATGRHRQALFATGVVLFVIIMILNLSATLVTRRRKPLLRCWSPRTCPNRDEGACLWAMPASPCSFWCSSSWTSPSRACPR